MPQTLIQVIQTVSSFGLQVELISAIAVWQHLKTTTSKPRSSIQPIAFAAPRPDDWPASGTRRSKMPGSPRLAAEQYQRRCEFRFPQPRERFPESVRQAGTQFPNLP